MSMRHVNGVYIVDTVRVLGEVELGADVNIWYGVVIRGDLAKITIGQGTNVQDNAVVHCDQGVPLVIGGHVTIGHGAIVHGRGVGDGTLIGMGAKLLGRTNIGKGCLIAAGAVVPPGMDVPAGMVVMGVPGKIVRKTTDEEKQHLVAVPPHYVETARLHHTSPDGPRVRPWGAIDGAST